MSSRPQPSGTAFRLYEGVYGPAPVAVRIPFSMAANLKIALPPSPFRDTAAVEPFDVDPTSCPADPLSSKTEADPTAYTAGPPSSKPEAEPAAQAPDTTPVQDTDVTVKAQTAYTADPTSSKTDVEPTAQAAATFPAHETHKVDSAYNSADPPSSETQPTVPTPPSSIYDVEKEPCAVAHDKVTSAYSSAADPPQQPDRGQAHPPHTPQLE